MRSLASMRQKLKAATGITVLAVASLVPLLHTNQTSAAQITARSITIGTSKISATDVLYHIKFTATTNAVSVKGIVVDFCNSATGPIVGTACTGPTSFDVNEAGLVVANQTINSVAVGNAYTIHVNTITNSLIITNATGNTVNTGDIVEFDMGSSGATDGVTNPSTTGTYYARILTYNSVAGAAAYVSATPGSHTDDGGLALSTANQLTVNARVQEQLQFCVGTTTVNDATTSVAASCAAAFTGTCGTTIDLGTIDSSVVSVSPVSVTPGNPGGGNACNGAAMVRTNAANGVIVTYFPEADGTGTNHTRALRVLGATCNADAYPSTTNTDQCFNSKGAGQGTIANAVESFGVTVSGINCGSTTSYSCVFSTGTYNMARNASYDGDGTNTYQADSGVVTTTTNGYLWSESATAATLASSAASTTKVVDDETLILKFAATSNITTPTGLYAVTSTYVATATF